MRQQAWGALTSPCPDVAIPRRFGIEPPPQTGVAMRRPVCGKSSLSPGRPSASGSATWRLDAAEALPAYRCAHVGYPA
jgi:hypothetical protein